MSNWMKKSRVGNRPFQFSWVQIESGVLARPRVSQFVDHKIGAIPLYSIDQEFISRTYFPLQTVFPDSRLNSKPNLLVRASYLRFSWTRRRIYWMESIPFIIHPRFPEQLDPYSWTILQSILDDRRTSIWLYLISNSFLGQIPFLLSWVEVLLNRKHSSSRLV